MFFKDITIFIKLEGSIYTVTSKAQNKIYRILSTGLPSKVWTLRRFYAVYDFDSACNAESYDIFYSLANADGKENYAFSYIVMSWASDVVDLVRFSSWRTLAFL